MTNDKDELPTSNLTEQLPFNQGCALELIWLAGKKGQEQEYLLKAMWHLNRELKRLRADENIPCSTCHGSKFIDTERDGVKCQEFCPDCSGNGKKENYK